MRGHLTGQVALQIPERVDPTRRRGLVVHHERSVCYWTITDRSPSDAELDRISADYEAAKARLAEIGFTCEGSLIERYTTCNNPNCRCADPAQRHGPYWQLSWKQAGKTVSRILPANDAAFYRELIANRRRLEAALDDMRALSRQAGERILAANGRPFHGPERPRRATG